MHTPEQAKELWCPMARVTQIGAVETNATYNRALIKTHVPIALRADEGGEGEAISATMLKTETQISAASRCVGDKCAMWRWGTFTAAPANAEPGKLVSGVNHRAGWGYCGLAGPVYQTA